MASETLNSPHIPNKLELESCLGEGHKLDGSFASLWSVEVILNILRKKPHWQKYCQWIPEYIFAICKRAFIEMDLQPISPKSGCLKCPSSNYTQDIFQDYQKLLSPPAPFPSIKPGSWQETPVLHKAATPWYAMGVIFQSQEWAQDGLKPLDQRPENQELALNWLVKEYIRSEFKEIQDQEFKNMAGKLLRNILWPPIFFDDNRRGQQNLSPIQKIFQTEPKPDDFLYALLRLLVSQDKMISVLSGAVCFVINIAPTDPLEARCLKRCLKYFNPLPTSMNGESHERVLEVIHMLSSSHESPLQGMNKPEFLESLKLANQKQHDLSIEKLTTLLSIDPKNALYLRTRGKQFEKLDKELYAYDDYNMAIRCKSDYWQALINRGTYYARHKKYKQAQSDFQAALKLRPDCENTRDNLLSIYFLNKTTNP